MQDQWADWVLTGHGRNETFVLANGQIHGRYDSHDLWAEVDDLLKTTWQHPGGARIYSVLLAHRAPVDRRAAADVITAHLVGERKRQAVNQAMASLRQGAKLEYLGAFVPRAGASAPETLVESLLTRLAEHYELTIETVETVEENIVFKTPMLMAG